MSNLTNLQVGDSLEEITLSPVSRMDLIKYSGASGDFNPIHTIDEEAEKAGLPGVIAHGMWTMGNLSKVFTSYYEEGFIENFQVRFSGKVFLNDVLTLRATLQEKNNETFSFKVNVSSQSEKVVMKGKVVFVTN
ncbi:MaoC/PaaZ C-terminal domain-containing protein [Oceanobacillus salinisoli]|uniref:MaoC/PaaZ C-terminal domain-containing protein n=1 Tax=Oceanobacillus salinisoli TaxID=2678611 RepID=UPI0012E31B66|nr:MaoC/PaaZ C-terminal domain-containing protein [Oceanobacillus salinisoli]